MKALIQVLKQQIIGVMKLSLPLIAIAHVYPDFFYSTLGVITCCFGMGVYIFYCHWRVAKNMVNALQFIPTGDYKIDFEKNIQECGMNPQAVALRYSYNESIASATFNTIGIDPLLWKSVEQDPEALKAIQVLNQYVVPGLSELQKNKLLATQELLCDKSERFIFKHELGHIFYNYSYRKLIVIGIVATLTACCGITAALLCVGFLGKLAILLGIIVSAITDLVLTYASNIVFKLREEQKADLFAAAYSSPEDIEAAANFFEKHQTILDTYKESTLLAKLSPEVASGHPHGENRALYLRKLAQQKKSQALKA
jgi:hypothetical protein